MTTPRLAHPNGPNPGVWRLAGLCCCRLAGDAERRRAALLLGRPAHDRPGVSGRLEGADAEGQRSYDLVENSFLGAGEEADVRAGNVNTIDEVPDSSWFTNRVGKGSGPLILQRSRRARTRRMAPPRPWTVIARKGEGVTPGFTIRDSSGEIYWIKFDPAGFAEMASGAEVISTKFFHAFGYHVAENYLATFRAKTCRSRRMPR